MNASLSPHPSVQEYLDLPSYLQAVYRWRKEGDPRFSYAAWAGELSLKSRSFLRLVLLGKRSITDKTLPHFVRSLKLSAADARYFEKLVRFSQASTFEEREYFEKDLIRPRNSVQVGEVHDQFQFLRTPSAPQIQTLITIPGVRWTTERIATSLGRTIAETNEALGCLHRLGLAEPSGDGPQPAWLPHERHFAVPTQAANHAIQGFHRASLTQAIAATDLDPETRHYQALLLNLSPVKYTELKQEIEALITAYRERYHDPEDAESVTLYQANFNLIPLSQPILRQVRGLDASVGNSPTPSDESLESL